MLSFKQFRLRETTNPADPHLPPTDDLTSLQVAINNHIDGAFAMLRQELRNRNNQGNPFNVMRQNLPWWRKAKNWWNRFWNNNTASESQENDLEFPDFIPLHEQEAFNELTLLMEGPVNDAINMLDARLTQLQQSLKNRINQLFDMHRSGVHTAPVGSPGAAATGSSTTGTTAGGGAPDRGGLDPEVGDGMHPEDDADQPDAGAEEPSSSEPPQDDRTHVGDEELPQDDQPDDGDEEQDHTAAPGPAEEKPKPEDSTPEARFQMPIEKIITREGTPGKSASNPDPIPFYGVVSAITLHDGTTYEVTDAEYDDAGNLVGVKIKGNPHTVFEIPPDMGMKHRIRYGRQKGTTLDIRRNIKASHLATPEIGTPPPPPGPKAPLAPMMNRRHGDLGAVDHEAMVSDEEDDFAGVDPSDETAIGRDDESPVGDRATAIQTAVEDATNWIKDSDAAPYLNPKLSMSMNSLPPEQRLVFANFFDGMDDGTKLMLFRKTSNIMDDEGEDLGKIRWVASLSPEHAREVGEKISASHGHGEKGKQDLANIFASPESFQQFAASASTNENALPLSRTRAFVERLRSNALKNYKQSIKDLPIDEQVEKYRRKLNSRARS